MKPTGNEWGDAPSAPPSKREQIHTEEYIYQHHPKGGYLMENTSSGGVINNPLGGAGMDIYIYYIYMMAFI